MGFSYWMNSGLNPPNTLANNLIEMANHQAYCTRHAPALIDISIQKGTIDQVTTMLEHFVFTALKTKT